ncbi:DUF6429 family protein [uncultured Ruegeria sp.]|uniref:DUF6429 family protein n=1 Tax=uncultured Ruegeria sp. TaxID=259304 RepID=UPI00345086E0
MHRKGLILDPKGKVKSVVLTGDGLRRSQALFTELFVKPLLRINGTVPIRRFRLDHDHD